MAGKYDELSKAELRERLEEADKGKKRLSNLILLAVVAVYVWLFRSELATALVKMGATVETSG